MQGLSPKSIKILKTCNLYLCFFVLGFCDAIPGPCLLDLQHLVQTDTQHIAIIYTARSVGSLLGSILGGILFDAIKSKQALMGICNFILASSMLLIPWSRNLGTLAAIIVVNGLALGAINTGGNVMCLKIWGGDSGPFFQALHFTFGLGALVAPLIAAPFLGDYKEEIHTLMERDNVSYFHNFTTLQSKFDIDNHSDSASVIQNITYPFSILGGFAQLVTFLFLAVCIMSPTEKKEARNKSSQDTTTSIVFLCTVVFLSFLLLFVETGIEIGYSQMLTTYAVKGQLQLPSSTGSFMTSAFWAAFTISRLASIFLAIKVSNFILIVYDLVITLVGSFVLLFLASHEWAVWLASVLLGAGIASFYPAVIAWTDSYINVTNKIASLFIVGGTIGEMLIPFIISYFIESAPDVFIYIILAFCISSSLIVFILYVILRKKREEKH